MNPYLTAAGVLIMALGIAHSLLGERLILVRLFKRPDLPELMGSELFTKRVLRCAWHLTTVLMLGLGLISLALAGGPLDSQGRWVLRIEALVFLVAGAVSLAATRARHFSWVVFLLISALLWIGTE